MEEKHEGQKDRFVFLFLHQPEIYTGRIIGRDGMNIREFEKQSGTSLIIGDGHWLIIKGVGSDVDRAAAVMQGLIKGERINPNIIQDDFKQYDEGEKPNEYVCEHCGIYEAYEPKCNKCEEEK
jgi:rRNA processing protein Krr1/Pno1